MMDGVSCASFSLAPHGGSQDANGGGRPGTYRVGSMYAECLPPPTQEITGPIHCARNLGISAVAPQMCRLLGPRGCVVRQDVLAVAHVDANSKDAADFVAWAAQH